MTQSTRSTAPGILVRLRWRSRAVVAFGLVAILASSLVVVERVAAQELVVRPGSAVADSTPASRAAMDSDELKLVRAKRPVEVPLDFSGDGGAPEEPANAEDLVRAMIEANPGRLVTIRVSGVPLRFDSLPSTTRKRLRERAGDSVEASYEQFFARRLAEFLDRMSARFPDAAFSIMGLPFHGRTEGDRISNRRYADVADRLDAFVLDRGVTTTSEDGRLDFALQVFPHAFDTARGRPILFRANRGWSMVISVKAIDSATAGPRRMIDATVVIADPPDDVGVLASPAVSDSPADAPGVSPEPKVVDAGSQSGSGATAPPPIRGGGGGSSASPSGSEPSSLDESEGAGDSDWPEEDDSADPPGAGSDESLDDGVDDAVENGGGGWDPTDEIDDAGSVIDPPGEQPGDGSGSAGGDEDPADEAGSDTSEEPSEGDWGDQPPVDEEDEATDGEGGDTPSSEQAGAGPVVSWEPIGNLEALVASASDGSVIDLSGRGFYASSDDDLVRITDRRVTFSGGRFTGAPPLEWSPIGDGVFEASTDLSQISDQRIYLIDPDAEAFPTLAQTPQPPASLHPYRMTYNQNWWVVNSNEEDNGDVLTVAGDDVTGGAITGVRISDPQMLSELDGVEASAGLAGLSLLYHAGPNLISAATVDSWDRGTGVLRFSSGSPLTYNGYLRFAVSGSPALLAGPGDYAIDASNDRVYYRPDDGDPTGARFPLASGLFRISGGEVEFHRCTIEGVRPGAGGGGAISGTLGAVVRLRSSWIHSVDTGVTSSIVHVEDSIVERCANRGMAVYSGSTIERSIVRDAENRSAVIVQVDNADGSGEVAATLVEDSIFHLPSSAHGQGISLYSDSWQNARIGHNIFIDCQRAISFQPKASASGRRTDAHSLVIENNLVVYDTSYGPLPGGQSLIAFNGATDEHLPPNTTQEVVLAHNTVLVAGDALGDPNAYTIQTIDLQKLFRSSVRCFGNICGMIYAENPGLGGSGTWMSTNQTVLERYGASWGAFDLPTPLDLESVLDPETFEPRGAASYMASDGGRLGIRWGSIPQRIDLDSLGPGWAVDHPARGVPTYQTGSLVFRGDDLR